MRKFWKAANKALDVFVILVCLFCVLICGYAMVDTALVYNAASDDSLLKYKPALLNPGEAEDRTLGIAWLTIDETTIDYPVMQGATNEEYLNKDPEGNYSLSGSIFLDYRNHADFSDDYSLVYGHHMAGGAMFGALDDFLSDEFLTSHRTGTLVVGQKVYDLDIFASMATTADVKEIFEPTETEGTLEYVRENAQHLLDVPEGRLVGLSTCADADTEDRTVVFAALQDNGRTLADLRSDTREQDKTVQPQTAERKKDSDGRTLLWIILAACMIAAGIAIWNVHKKRTGKKKNSKYHKHQ
ncbi:MAG: class B sortase [Eubacterium sp.]|nr:class B sortase [Eubacterium sp.]